MRNRKDIFIDKINSYLRNKYTSRGFRCSKLKTMTCSRRGENIDLIFEFSALNYLKTISITYVNIKISFLNNNIFPRVDELVKFHIVQSEDNNTYKSTYEFNVVLNLNDGEIDFPKVITISPMVKEFLQDVRYFGMNNAENFIMKLT